MTPDQIIAALTRVGKTIPTQALAAADTQRAELTPHLLASLAELSAHPGNPKAIDQDHQLPFFAMYLLAAWCERRAHPLLLAFLRLPGEECMDLSGDIVTEDMDRMLAQTAGGDPTDLLTLARDPAANIWGRNAAIRALGAMTQWNMLPKSALAAHCRELLSGLPASLDHEDASILFGSIVDCVMQHGLHELRDAVLTTADQEWIDPMVAGDRADLEAEFTRPPYKPPVEPIADVSAEIGWWGCFQKERPARPFRLPPTALPPPERSAEIPQPYRAPPKVGRNDPCPCGSGKKHKKCCGG